MYVQRDFSLALFSSFLLVGYVRGITSSPLLQPTIFCFLFLVGFVLLGRRFLTDRSALVALLLALYLSILLIVQYLLFDIKLLNEFGRIVYPFVVFFLLTVYFRQNYSLNISRFLYYIVRIIVVMLVFDFFYRLLQAGSFSVTSRYSLKMDGLMFVDSNFNGFFAGFLLFLNTVFPLGFRVNFVLSVLVLLSFSLAVYFGLLICFIFLFSTASRYSFFFTIFMLFFIILLFFNYISLFYANVLEDGSLITKFEIVRISLDVLTNFDLNSFFGVGSGTFKSAFDYKHASHNAFGIASEIGLVSVCFMLSMHFIVGGFNRFSAVGFLYILVIGAISLFPVTYLSLIYFLLFLTKRWTKT